MEMILHRTLYTTKPSKRLVNTFDFGEFIFVRLKSFDEMYTFNS